MMLSRVAESTYWMARYFERAEDTARLVNVTANLLLDLPRKFQLGWEPLLDIINRRADFYKKYETASERNVIKYLVSDKDNSSSILSSIIMGRENTRSIREILPRDIWEAVNQLYLNARDSASDSISRTKRFSSLRSVIFDIQCIAGIIDGTMTHDEAYHFVKIGRSLERADMTSRILDVQSASLLGDIQEEIRTFQTIQWVSVLKSLSAYQMYRKALHISVRRGPVIRFLMKEKLFPRSFLHCLAEIESGVKKLPGNGDIRKFITKLSKEVEKSKPEKLDQLKLHNFIDQLQSGLNELHGLIHKKYF